MVIWRRTYGKGNQLLPLYGLFFLMIILLMNILVFVFFNLDKDTMSIYGNTFASFLPGISMTLCRVIKGDSRQGQGVIVVSLLLFYFFNRYYKIIFLRKEGNILFNDHFQRNKQTIENHTLLLFPEL